HVEAQRLDLPDAIFLHVAVLIDAIAPFGVLLVLAEHSVVAPAGGGAHAVTRHVDRRLEREPFVELAVDQPFLPAVETLEVFADAILADIDPVDAELERAVRGEEIRRLAPPPAVDVETDRALHLLDRARAFEPFAPLRELCDLRVVA